MPEHYTRNTLEATKWCNRCGRPTQHAVSAGRIAHCLDCLLHEQIAAHAEKLRRGEVRPLRATLGYYPGDAPQPEQEKPK